MQSGPRARFVAFRLSAHNLTAALPAQELERAAGVAGLQTSRVDSAAIALANRVDAVRPEDVTRALDRSGTLVTIWSMRGAPYVVPTCDIAVFTAGAAPDPQLSLKEFATAWAEHLLQAGVDLNGLISDIATAAKAALRDGPLPVDDLRNRIYAALPQLHPIERPQFARADMPEPFYRLLGPLGVACIVEGEGTRAVIGALGDRVPRAVGGVDQHSAKLELLRRYLHAYGPATDKMFAEWTTRSVREVRALIADLGDELVPIEVDGSHHWLLATDEEALRSPPDPVGLHLLPPLDPFLAQRDRATVIADRKLAAKVWRPLSPPGVVLHGADIIAVWRSTRKGRRLAVTVEPFAPVPAATAKAIEARAAELAPFRGAEDVSIEVVR